MSLDFSTIIAENAQRFELHKQWLGDLITFPSIRFSGFDQKPLYDCAQYIQKLLEDCGAVNIQVWEMEDSAPFIFAEKRSTNPKAPTLLLYAHYDVQPPMDINMWRSPPFEATQKGDRLYGRGSADDKAGVVAHLATLQAFQELDIPVNLKILFEGEEECGSPNLEKVIKTNARLLQADAMVIADLSNLATGTPTITTSLRGMAALEVEVQSLDHSLHSGLWGGPLPDPAFALCQLLAKLTDEKGDVIVPGFYDEVIAPNKIEIASWKSLELKADDFKHQSGLLADLNLLCSESQLPEYLWRRPVLTLSTIQGGDRKNAGNVLLSSAWARLTFRLAPGMQADSTLKKVSQFLKEKVPANFRLYIKQEAGSANAWVGSSDGPIYRCASNALKDSYHKDCLFVGCGATIPFVETMSTSLGGIPALLLGIEDPDSRAHSENESLFLPDFKAFIEAQIRLVCTLPEYVDLKEG